ncbi:MAG: DUF1292 domain-containing protein [Halanaerobiaceae bacterium]
MAEEDGTFWIDEETEELVLTEGGEEERFYVEQEVTIDDNRYVILIPSEKGKYEEGEALALKLQKEDEGEVLSIIEDDAEFKKVKEAYLE